MVLKEIQHFVMPGNSCLRQRSQTGKHEFARQQVADGQFPDHEGMHQDIPLTQQSRDGLIAGPQVIDPDRGIDKDHFIGVAAVAAP